MNCIAVIILFSIIADFTLHFFSDFLNLKMLPVPLPKAFKGLYHTETYNKSKEYLKTNTLFGWVDSGFDLILIIFLWFGKFFPMLDQWVRSFNKGGILTGLCYIGALLLLKYFLTIPFLLYSTFVIEEKFGFNKTTLKTFIIDSVKGVVLFVIIGGVLLAGILIFFEYAGNRAWWLCWSATALFMLLIQFVAPTWIMPLFNKFTPLEEGELKDAIVSYAESIDFLLENVYVMDGSRRSAKSNAFFTGFGKNRRIVLFDTLIEKHTVDELVSVLAHEMGHYKKKHIIKMMLFSIAQIGVMFYLLSLFISNRMLFDAFYMKQQSVYAGLIFFGMLYSPIGFFTGIFLNMYSRKNEFEADSFAVKTAKNSDAMASALKKLSVDNLSNLTPHPFYVFLNYSHPPVMERIKAMGKL